jgi:hypothetical protein
MVVEVRVLSWAPFLESQFLQSATCPGGKASLESLAFKEECFREFSLRSL